jgi:hypothetical protein
MKLFVRRELALIEDKMSESYKTFVEVLKKDMVICVDVSIH